MLMHVNQPGQNQPAVKRKHLGPVTAQPRRDSEDAPLGPDPDVKGFRMQGPRSEHTPAAQ
jgi:hypothetical protein